MATNTSKKPTMADLMANYAPKRVSFFRGEKVTGKVISINNNEIVVDLGGKTEGVLDKRELGEEINVNDSISAFVINPENDFGQTTLSLNPPLRMSKGSSINLKKWQRLILAKQSHFQLKGRVVDLNRGGLMVEVEGVRGFVPSSQLSLEVLAGSKDLSNLAGKELALWVIEVEPENNRVVLSSRKTSPELKAKLAQFKAGDKVKGKVAAITVWGVFGEIDGVEGLIFPQEVAWEKTEDWGELFELGQEIEAVVVGVDEHIGRLNLSIRQLSQDPFTALVQNYQVDDVVGGEIVEVAPSGYNIRLADGVAGFLPSSKVEAGSEYQLGQTVNFLIDSIDVAKRRINLTPFITSTVGLIYK